MSLWRSQLALIPLLLAIPAAAQNQGRPPHAYDLQSNYLRWPVPEGEEEYGRIDGARMKRWVEEMTAISRRSRDRGDQYWGRIAGAKSDEETEAWVTAAFERLGLQNVHSQPFELAPQWFPTSWEASLVESGSKIALDTAHPAKGAPARPGPPPFSLHSAFPAASPPSSTRPTVQKCRPSH